MGWAYIVEEEMLFREKGTDDFWWEEMGVKALMAKAAASKDCKLKKDCGFEEKQETKKAFSLNLLLESLR